MQIYVNKDGQQYGPFTVEHLRHYVQQGSFTTADYACYDGQNWVTVEEVLGQKRIAIWILAPILTLIALLALGFVFWETTKSVGDKDDEASWASAETAHLKAELEQARLEAKRQRAQREVAELARVEAERRETELATRAAEAERVKAEAEKRERERLVEEKAKEKQEPENPTQKDQVVDLPIAPSLTNLDEQNDILERVIDQAYDIHVTGRNFKSADRSFNSTWSLYHLNTITGTIKSIPFAADEEYVTQGSQTPYTGWTKYYYHNGPIWNLDYWKDGKLHGSSFAWYDNSRKQFKRTYRNGKRNGIQSSWWDNGQKCYEGTFRDGEAHGIWKWWYPTGRKRYERTYKDGKLESAVAWRGNGDKCSGTDVVNGSGKVRLWTNAGSKVFETKTYKKGEIVP